VAGICQSKKPLEKLLDLKYSLSTMGRIYESLQPDLVEWIQHQHVYFVATAPEKDGHVNCSPKGLDTLRILGPRAVAYLDLTGSGVETVAHLRENGRILLMFCAFEGPPKIVRIHGHGTVVASGEKQFGDLLLHFAHLDQAVLASARAVIQIDAERISDSCGHGVPMMTYEADRSQIPAWTDNRLRKLGPEAMAAYWAEKNAASIDGMPGLEPVVDPAPAGK
jgi:hypothetical protein